MRNLIDIASKGGNYLLNVGPTAEGEIPAESVKRLEEVGQWMAVNGEAIYGTSASPFKRLAWGRCTQKPGKLYPARLRLAKGRTDRAGLEKQGHKGLSVGRSGEKTTRTHRRKRQRRTVKVPENAPNPIASVVVLEIEGSPQVEQPHRSPKPPTARSPCRPPRPILAEDYSI